MNFIFDTGLVLYLPLHELPGSSFMSRDARGHMCTVTGAVWRPNARYFDGTDDFIGTGQPIVPDGSFTVIVWQKNAETQDTLRCVWEKYLTNQVDIGLMYYAFDAPWASVWNPGLGQRRIDALPNSDTDWHMVTWTNNSGTNTVYVDDQLSQTRTISAGPSYGSPSDTFSFSFTGTANRLFTVGRGYNNGRYYRGDIGLVLVYNRGFSPQEVQHNYLATKWRYQ